MSGLLGAIQFLTRIPVRVATAVPHARTLPWFAVVGALIGTAAGALAWATSYWMPPLVTGSLAVGAGLLITGAFHEDGLADVADAFGGGWDREQRLAILKDSHHGTYGVAALAFSIVVRVVAVGSITDGAVMFVALVSAHTLGRTAAALGAVLIAPAGDGGLGAAAGRDASTLAITASGLWAVAVTVALGGWWAAVFAAVALAALAAVSLLAVRKIGGMVGDVLGAIEQVVECLVLVAASGLAMSHQLWWR